MTEQRAHAQKMVLCCGKRKGCPVIAAENDGFVLSDPDQTAPGRVELKRDEAEKLYAALGEFLWKRDPGGPRVEMDVSAGSGTTVPQP